jgi:hypothetical protein
LPSELMLVLVIGFGCRVPLDLMSTHLCSTTVDFEWSHRQFTLQVPHKNGLKDRRENKTENWEEVFEVRHIFFSFGQLVSVCFYLLYKVFQLVRSFFCFEEVYFSSRHTYRIHTSISNVTYYIYIIYVKI